MTCPLCNDIEGILGTRDIVKLHEVCEVGMNEDEHVNPSGSISKDNTNHKEKDIIGKENIAGSKTVTNYSERETDKSVIDRENDEVNSSFIDALNHEKEKKDSHS